MLRRLTQLLRPTPSDSPSAEDGRTALAALMVRVARADDDYTATEQQMIAQALADRFGLDPASAHALRQRGEGLEASAGDTVHLTRPVKDVVALDVRPALLVQRWALILSDDARHEEEDGLMRLVANLLGLSDRDSALARQRAARGG